MKNTASSSPLNGSRSISSSWRYSLSASTTPAKNVPSAADNPTSCMSRRDADDDQQRECDEDLADARARNPAEQRLHQVAAREHDRGHDGEHDDRPTPRRQRRECGALVRRRRQRRQQRQQRQHRNDRHVLEQQHGEARAPRRGLEQPALVQALQHDRRRRHREREARDEGALPREPEQHGGGADHEGRQHDLQAAEPEDRLAEIPQLLRLQLEPDEKQHHGDAELREVQDVRRFAGRARGRSAR